MEKCGGTEEGGRVGGSLETLMLETSDAQLGVQAGGWESSFGDSVWVVMGVCMIVDRIFAKGDRRRA